MISRSMNDRRIAFIMCSNDDLYASECELYIRSLSVPDGYEVDVLIVKEATSMAAGYNEAMRATDAKYKVYLHQDVLMRQKRFIFEILRIFQSDESIGMIGVVGNPVIPENGVMWDGKNDTRVGGVYGDAIYSASDELIRNPAGEYQEVEVVDGLLIATQYDIPWREDVYDGWHFYDCSQSLEFRRAGYRIVVPHMDKPWCFHDNDVHYLGEDYEKYRRRFCLDKSTEIR